MQDVRDARAPVSALLAVLLVGLVSLVATHPIDPTWIDGYWDNDDFDAVAVLIGTASALALSTSIAAPRPGSPVATVEHAEPGNRSRLSHSAASPRAPPPYLRPLP